MKDRDLDSLYRKALKSALDDRDSVAKMKKRRRHACADRLYALNDLRHKLAHDRKRLNALTENGLSLRSATVARFERSGVRLSPEQIYFAIVKDYKAKIAAVEFEIESIEEVLDSLKNDPYYITISDKYFEGLCDGFTAKTLQVDPSTVRRQRARLLDKIAVRLEGMDAL